MIGRLPFVEGEIRRWEQVQLDAGRQLQVLLERPRLVRGQVIEAETDQGIDLDGFLQSVERRYVEEALRSTGGNKTEALKLGAHGIVPKDTSPELLFKSIRAVMAGQYWLGRQSVSNLVETLKQYRNSAKKAKPKNYGLTPREMEIVRAVVSGYANKEIAGQLSISEQTVNERPDHILRALVSEDADIAAFSCYIWNIELTLRISAEMKLLHPGLYIILGGPESSIFDLPNIVRGFRFSIAAMWDEVSKLNLHVLVPALQMPVFFFLGRVTGAALLRKVSAHKMLGLYSAITATGYGCAAASR